MNRYRLAKELSAHVCAHRGYAFAFGGYHTQGGGFWLSAAYLAAIGVFVLKSDRGSSSYASDCDLLVRAFTTGVVRPPLAGMLDPGKYACHRLFFSAVSLPPLTTSQALLSSGNVASRPAPGFVEVTIAEYLPVARAASGASAGIIHASPSARPAPRATQGTSSATRPRRPLMLGEVCAICGEVAVERALLTSTYVACGCG